MGTVINFTQNADICRYSPLSLSSFRENKLIS